MQQIHVITVTWLTAITVYKRTTKLDGSKTINMSQINVASGNEFHNYVVYRKCLFFNINKVPIILLIDRKAERADDKDSVDQELQRCMYTSHLVNILWTESFVTVHA